VFLALGFWISSAMDDIHLEIADTLDAAAEQALSGDLQAGMASARKAKADWQAHWHNSATVADHAPMDEIDGLLAQLECYSRANMPGDFAACCTRIALLVRAMREAHSLTWWNLL
jgi:hypothetical protein